MIHPNIEGNEGRLSQGDEAEIGEESAIPASRGGHLGV
jgi:hypothetical protein